MSYANGTINKYNEPTKNIVHEILWQNSNKDEANVHEKVSRWLIETTRVLVIPDSDSADTLPDQIESTPVIKKRKYRVNEKTTNGNEDAAKISPSKTEDQNNSSPILRRYSSKRKRKRKSVVDSEIKHEISSLAVDVKFQQTSQTNSLSPVIISKRYSSRKNERSFTIKNEISTENQETLSYQIEEDEGTLEFKKSLPCEFNINFSSVTEKTLNEFEKIEIENEYEIDEDKENIVVDTNYSFLKEEVNAGNIVIEELYSQELDDKIVRKVDIVDFSQVSDVTYCEDAEMKIDLIESSQMVENSVQLLDEKKDIAILEQISQNSFPGSGTEKATPNDSTILSIQNSSGGNGTRLNFSTADGIRRKKKLQKNSLFDRLKNLIGTAASFNRLWRYQILQPQFQKIYKQFVLLSIKDITTFNDRYFFECEIIKDDSNLLSTLLNGSHKVTVIAIPEIVGSLTIPNNSCMKVYPPWKIIDRESRMLESSHFIFDINLEKTESNEDSTKVMEQTVKFDCPCLQNNSISEYCDNKFRNCKYNLVEEIFKL